MKIKSNAIKPKKRANVFFRLEDKQLRWLTKQASRFGVSFHAMAKQIVMAAFNKEQE